MTQIYALIDCWGRPIRLHPSKEQASDCKQAEPLLAFMPKNSTFFTDSGYDLDAIWRQATAFFGGQHTRQA